MPTLIQPSVLTAPANVAGASSIQTAAITIPANVLVCVDVVNRHTTPASLGTITLAGSTLGSIAARATVTEGGASPTRRLTRFYILSSVDVAGEVLTATASGSQTGIGMRVTSVPGTYAAGGAAGAVRGGTTANSAGANVTTLTTSALPAFGDINNGGLAAFISGAGGVTAKSGWTEIVETTQPTSVQHELQWIGSNDTTANATQASATLACIFDEIVAAPNPITYNVSAAGNDASQGYFAGSNTFPPGGTTPVFRAGRTMLLHFCGSGNTANLTSFALTGPDGVTFNAIYGRNVNAGSALILIYLVTVVGAIDVNLPFTITGTATGGGNVRFVWQLLECQNVDQTQGTSGIIQMVDGIATSSGTVVNVTPATFGKVMNNALVLSAGVGANTAPVGGGGITGYKALSAAQINSLASVQSFSRPNAPASLSVTSGQSNFDVVLIEMASLSPNIPVINLVSPALGPIAYNASVTIDVTDSDGDLSTVSIFANGAPVYTGGAFQSGFLSSTKTAITNGFRFVITRTGNWVAGSLGIDVSATDTPGHSAFQLFYFSSVTLPTSNPPTITLVSPPPGALSPTDDIVISVGDVDADLVLFVPQFTPSLTGLPEIPWSSVGGFSSGYPSSGLVAGGGLGTFTFRRLGGWPPGSLSFLGLATDATGHLTTATFTWTISGGVTPEPPALSIVEPVFGDVALIWADGSIDGVIIDDDVGADQGLRTAVLISLFTDRRAEDDDVLPSDDGDRRGWWGDELAAVQGDKIGSRLWLLDRSARRGDIVRVAEEYAREALAWMIEDKVTDKIDITVEATTGGALLYTIGIARPQRDPVSFRFQHTWDSIEANGP